MSSQILSISSYVLVESLREDVLLLDNFVTSVFDSVDCVCCVCCVARRVFVRIGYEHLC